MELSWQDFVPRAVGLPSSPFLYNNHSNRSMTRLGVGKAAVISSNSHFTDETSEAQPGAVKAHGGTWWDKSPGLSISRPRLLLQPSPPQTQTSKDPWQQPEGVGGAGTAPPPPPGSQEGPLAAPRGPPGASDRHQSRPASLK